MAGQLRRSRHRGLLALIVLLVLLAHGWLGRTLQLQPAPGEATPPRLAAAFVRELVEQAPPKRLVAPKPSLRPGPMHSRPLAPLPEVPILEEFAELAELAAPAELPAAAASAPAEPAEPGPEWPLSTQLSYRLQGNFRGPLEGEAQVQWLRQGRRYQVHLDVLVGARFAPLITRRMSSDGLLTPQGIAPERYDEDTKMLLREARRSKIAFEGQVLLLADGKAQPQPPGVQDAASQFVHLTWLFLTGRQTLRPGLVIEMPLALPRRLYRWRYEVIGEEELYTPMGPLSTWHLRPLFDHGQGRVQDLKAEVWLAPGLQYLPVRLLIRQDDGSHLDLMLKAPPLQAAPDPIVAPIEPQDPRRPE